MKIIRRRRNEEEQKSGSGEVGKRCSQEMRKAEEGERKKNAKLQSRTGGVALTSEARNLYTILEVLGICGWENRDIYAWYVSEITLYFILHSTA